MSSFECKIFLEDIDSKNRRQKNVKTKIPLFLPICFSILAVIFESTQEAFGQKGKVGQSEVQLNEPLISLGFPPAFLHRINEIPLIWYETSNKDSYQTWIRATEEFLQPYKNSSIRAENRENRVQCDYGEPAPPGKVCDVNVSDWHPCMRRNSYNYHNSEPCVFLKLTKMLGWTPNYYNSLDSDLPQDMPNDLKKFLYDSSDQQRNNVWVSCEGENPNDVENMGSINYIPRRGFPQYYFPYQSDQGYLDPLVAVFIEKPKLGVLIHIVCKVWAKDIKHDRTKDFGSVRFALMIDK